MNVRLMKKFVPALLAAGVMGVLGAAELPASAEATLPQAAHRISNWALNGHEGLWIEAVDGRWYYGEFFAPCVWPVAFDTIALKYNPDGSFNRFSYVIGRHPRQLCALKSFVHSEGPGSGADVRAARVASPAMS